MSTLFVRFRAESLACNGEFYMHLPPKTVPFFMKGNPYYERDTRTLILLHGYSGDSTDWLYNSAAADFSLKYNLAVVMPSGGIGFYVDKKATGHQYCRFIGEDLIQYLRETFGLAQNREDTYIGGLSMGGFGALHTGFMYPDTFGGVMALSSALIIHGLKNMKPDMPDPVMANYEYYVDTFGDLSKAEASDHNPEVLFTRNKENGVENPRIYMACGTEDFLLENNRRMHLFLEEEKIPHRYYESAGNHDMVFWNEYIQKAVEWMFG